MKKHRSCRPFGSDTYSRTDTRVESAIIIHFWPLGQRVKSSKKYFHIKSYLYFSLECPGNRKIKTKQPFISFRNHLTQHRTLLLYQQLHYTIKLTLHKIFQRKPELFSISYGVVTGFDHSLQVRPYLDARTLTVAVFPEPTGPLITNTLLPF